MDDVESMCVHGTRITALKYADDIVLHVLADNEEGLQDGLQALHNNK